MSWSSQVSGILPVIHVFACYLEYIAARQLVLSRHGHVIPQVSPAPLCFKALLLTCGDDLYDKHISEWRLRILTMIFMLSTAVISLLRTVLPRSADSFADRIQCWLQSQQMCCSFAFFHVVSTPKLLFIYVIASPMMIPIFDIPEHHDVKHWVLKHVFLPLGLRCLSPCLTLFF